MEIRTQLYRTLSIAATMTMFVACSEIEDVTNHRQNGDGRITFSATETAIEEGTMRSQTASDNLKSIEAKTDDGQTVYLHAVVTPQPVSQGTMRGTKTESVAGISNFGVTAYRTANEFNTDKTTGAVGGTSYFSNIKAKTGDATPTASSEWNTYTNDESATAPYYWPDGTDKLSFFAYSPWNSASPFGTSGGAVTLDYTADGTVADQKDLLVAAAFDENHSTSLDPKQALNFKHALTAVTFSAAADLFPCTVTKITLTGIPTKNTYTYGLANGSNGTWATTGSIPQTFTFTLSQAVSGSATPLTSGSNTLLMVPQTLPSNAKVTIEFTDGASRSHTLSYPLSGQIWQAGKQVNYTLSTSNLTSIQIDFASDYAAQGSVDTQVNTFISGSTLNKTFTSSKKIGLYVVDIVNKKIVASNVPIPTTNTASVTVDGLDSKTLAAQAFLSDSTDKYRYFAYYPYQTTAPTTIAASAVSTTTTGEQFFANLISGWTPPANQSAASAATINEWDLQVGDVIGTGSGITSKKLTIKLRHQMGLAAIKMGSGTPTYDTYTLDGNKSGGESGYYKYSTTGSGTLYALDEFADNLPYKVGTRNTATLRCYFLVNPAKSYTFGTTYKYGTTNTYKQWDDFTVASNSISKGNYKVLTTSAPKFKNLGRLYSYSATGRQDYTPILKDCKYQMECWGASGGKLYGSYETMSTGGRGGYTKGTIKLTTANISSYPKLYVYVGQKGSDWNGPDNPSANCPTSWNGGGAAYNACGGGGATDIRLSTGNQAASIWNNATSLASRIMVAGAGGGANDYGFGGAGGGINGQIGITSPASEGKSSGSGTGGSQTGGGTGKASGGIGYGGGVSDYDGGAGGGGYYGGGQGSTHASSVGGGGSSYISGLSGCTNHSSGLKFDPAVTYPGTVAVYTASGPTGTNTTIPDPNKVEGQLLAYNQYSVNGYARIIIKPYD